MLAMSNRHHHVLPKQCMGCLWTQAARAWTQTLLHCIPKLHKRLQRPHLQPRNWENEASKERSKPASGKTSRLSGFLWLSPSASARSLGLVFPKNIAAKCAWTLPSLSEVSWNSLIGKSMQLQKLSSIFTVALPMLASKHRALHGETLFASCWIARIAARICKELARKFRKMLQVLKASTKMQ